jgi:serine/threonine protein kinase
MHRDLKPENVLIDKDYNVRIIDFGLAAKYTLPKHYTICGSPGYIAPEIIRAEPYDGSKVDVFSIGVLLYLLVTGAEPFGARSLQHRIRANKLAEVMYPDALFGDLSPQVLDLTKQLLEPNPAHRVSAKKALAHPWFIRTLNLSGDSMDSSPIKQSQPYIKESSPTPLSEHLGFGSAAMFVDDLSEVNPADPHIS